MARQDGLEGRSPAENGAHPEAESPHQKRVYKQTRLGRLLRERRDLANLSQDEVAKRTGIARDTIKGLERGIIKTINPDYADRIGRVLNIRVDEMVVAMGYNLPTADEIRLQQQSIRDELTLLNTIRAMLDRRHKGRPRLPEHEYANDGNEAG